MTKVYLYRNGFFRLKNELYYVSDVCDTQFETESELSGRGYAVLWKANNYENIEELVLEFVKVLVGDDVPIEGIDCRNL